MAFERLLPNADDSGWPTGTFEDINQGVNTPTDANFMASTTKGDLLVLDFVPSAIVDADVVRRIGFRIRGRTGNAGATEFFRITFNGTTVTLPAMGTTFLNQFATHVNWDNLDQTAAQMDAIQVTIEAEQSGMPEATSHELSEFEIIIGYDPTTPVFGDVVKQNRTRANTGTTVTGTLASAPTSGNLLIAAVVNYRTVDRTLSSRPTGFTLLTEQEGTILGSALWDWCYKISDGSETSVVYTFGELIENNTGGAVINYWEIDWDGSTPDIITNEDITKVDDTVANTVTTGAATPVGASNVVVGLISTAFVTSSFIDMEVDGAWKMEDWWEQVTLYPDIHLVSLVDVTGSQIATHLDTDNGNEIYGAIAVFEPTVGNEPITGLALLVFTPVGDLGGSIGRVTGLATNLFTPVGDLAGSIGQVTGLSTNLFTPVSDLTGIGVLDVSAVGTFTPTSVLTQAPAAITGLATIAFTPVGDLGGSIGKIAGNLAILFTPVSGLKGIGVLAVTVSATFAPSGTIADAFDPGEPITGSASITFSPTSNLTGIGVLDVTSSIVFTPLSDLTGIGVLAGSTSVVFLPLSDLTGIGVLDVSVIGTFLPTSILTGITGATLDQEGFRFRNDDGTEVTATWVAAQEVDISEAIGVTKRLRILVDGDGDVSSQQFRLEVKKNTDPDSAYKIII